MHAEETILHDSAPADHTKPLTPEQVVNTAACFDPTQPTYWTNERLYKLALEAVTCSRTLDSAKAAAREMLAAVSAREAA